MQDPLERFYEEHDGSRSKTVLLDMPALIDDIIIPAMGNENSYHEKELMFAFCQYLYYEAPKDENNMSVIIELINELPKTRKDGTPTIKCLFDGTKEKQEKQYPPDRFNHNGINAFYDFLENSFDNNWKKLCDNLQPIVEYWKAKEWDK